MEVRVVCCHREFAYGDPCVRVGGWDQLRPHRAQAVVRYTERGQLRKRQRMRCLYDYMVNLRARAGSADGYMAIRGDSEQERSG